MSVQERVRVVDDSPQNCIVARGHLEAAGHDVAYLSSGEEALEMLAMERFDLVILDVLMPGLGGFETCRVIRTTPAIAETPVLYSEGLVLGIVDDGPGVPVEETQRIFERYVTLDADPARSGSHGLGLTFCRLAAEAQGGRIWVEERVGGGASFCVRIPQPAGQEPVRSRSRRDPVE